MNEHIKLLDEKSKRIIEEDDDNIKNLIDLLPSWSYNIAAEYAFEFDVTLPDDIIVVVLADWHVGSIETAYDLLANTIQAIMTHKNVYILVLGDLIDNFNVRTASLGNQALIPLPRQKQIVEYYLDVMKEKMIGIGQGNHEERSVMTDGYDYSEYIARKLRVNYLGFMSKVNLNIVDANGGEISTVKVLCGHKYKGFSIYNPVHQCIRASREIDPNADIIIFAHFHNKAMMQTQDKVYMQSGAFQRTSRWARSVGYNPATEIGANCFAVKKGKIIPYLRFEEALELHGKKYTAQELIEAER
jgi:hypothetical protein